MNEARERFKKAIENKGYDINGVFDMDLALWAIQWALLEAERVVEQTILIRDSQQNYLKTICKSITTLREGLK